MGGARITVAVLCAALAACAHRPDPARLGREAMGRGDYREAGRQLQQATDQNPQDASLWRDLARAHMRAGEPGDARIAIARALELDPSSVSAVLLRGQIRMGQGDRTGALADARFVLGRAKRPRVLQETAVLFTRLGQADASLQAARKAIERSRGDADAYTNLAVLAVELRRLDVAAKAFTEGRRRHPDHLPLAEAEAAFLVATGDLARARKAYRALLSRHDKPALIHLALALLAHEQGDLDDAVLHARKAVDLVGHQRADVHYTHIVILRDRGESDKASTQLRRARRRFPAHDGLAQLASGAD